MVSIRNMGNCPCPRCKIPLNDAFMVGMAPDCQARQANKCFDDIKRQEAVFEARKAIFQRNLAVDSTFVERQLKDDSLVPSIVGHHCLAKAAADLYFCISAQNAFSKRLSKFGFNLFPMFLVDLMHEIELGVWKALLVHLLRMLESVHENLLHEFDKRRAIYPDYFHLNLITPFAPFGLRFRQVPIFGRDTIRRFSANTLELKRMAAWNFEDFLQVVHQKLTFLLSCLQLMWSSVLSRYSKDFYLSRTIQPFCSYCFIRHTGMDLRNFACIAILRLPFLTKKL
jgi:hypothetical protein